MKTAQWIWCDAACGESMYADFFAEIPLQKTEEPVTLQILAEHQYAVFWNGAPVAWGQYPDLPGCGTCQTHALPAPPHAQPARLLVRVFCQSADSLTRRKGRPGVRFEITQGGAAVYGSGTHTWCAPSPSYESAGVGRITPQLGDSFVYHHDREWRQMPPRAALRHAVPAPRKEKLRARAVPALDVREPCPMQVQSQGVFFRAPAADTPGDACQYAALGYREREALLGREQRPTLPDGAGLCLRSQEGDGIYLLLDAGETVCGLLTLDTELPAGTRVDIAFGEHLEDLRVRSGIDGRSFCVTYFAGGERRGFTHWFQRLGGRYLQLYIHARAGTIYYAGLRPVVYPVGQKSVLRCGDHMHAAILEVSQKTLLACMHDHFEDCPWREQALYALDSRQEMLCAYYAFGEYRLARESIRLLGGTLRPDGLLELCAPGREEVTIPGFTLTWPCQLADYVLFSGDTAFGAEMLPTALCILRAALKRRAENGLVPAYSQAGYWNFYEWSPQLDGGEIHRKEALPLRFDAPLNALLILALHSASELAQWLGQAREVVWLAAAADGLRAAMERFWDEREGCYASYLSADGVRAHHAELTQALVLCAGACPTERSAALARRLLTGEGLSPLTLGSCYFRYEALLSQEGFSRAVFDEIARRWGRMLREGARTFWETERGAEDFHRAGSLCHGWAAIPIYFYYAYGLGVRPTKPGFHAYTVAPAETGAAFYSGVVPTPNGALQIPLSH